MKVLAPTHDAYERILDDLTKIGINYKVKSPLKNPFENANGSQSQFEVQIEGTIDHSIKRALLKILMNFSAKYIGPDKVLKGEWDKCREYVRWNRAPILARVSHKPFWGEESENLRLESDSYNIRVENVGTDVIGVIQFFNLNTYEFKMVEGYNIPEAKEIAGRFTPGKEPTFGVKGPKTRA